MPGLWPENHHVPQAPGYRQPYIGVSTRVSSTIREYSTMGRRFKSNQSIGAIMTFLFSALLIYILITPWAHRKLRDGFLLGFFPGLAILLLIIFSLILIFDSRRKQVPDRLENLTFKYFLYTILAIICCFIYFKVMTGVGFLIATPLFLFISMYALGIKSLQSLLTVSVLISVIVYAIFRIMGIELPPTPFYGI